MIFGLRTNFTRSGIVGSAIALVGLLLVGVPTLLFGDDKQNQGNGDLFVPSNYYPTIQSAINAAPDHGVVHISGGIFNEAVMIQGKTITLQGSANPQLPTEIRVTDQISAVVTFGLAGGGTLRNLILRNGAVGISAPSQEWLASVDTDALLIHGCGRGVFGRFDTLTLRRSTIESSLFNGMAIFQARRINLDRLLVAYNRNIGILLYNLGKVPGPTWTLSDSTVIGNPGGGIYIVGGVTPVKIGENVIVDGNGFGGIILQDAQNVLIQNTQVSNTLPDATAAFGDGIIARSSAISVVDTQIRSNSRAGLSVFGVFACDATLNSATLKNVEFVDNPIDLDGESLPACPSWTLKDNGGNTCTYGGSPRLCQVLSSGLAPPTPPSP